MHAKYMLLKGQCKEGRKPFKAKNTSFTYHITLNYGYIVSINSGSHLVVGVKCTITKLTYSTLLCVSSAAIRIHC